MRGVRVVRRRVRADPLRQPDARRSSRSCKGRRRVETDRFVALRSHYLFESQFTHAGHRGRAREGRRRGRGRPLPPQPPRPGPDGRRPRRAQRAAARRLRGGPARGGSSGAPETVGEALGARAAAAAARCPPSRSTRPRPRRRAWIAKSLVTVRQNRYSVPVALAGLKVSARDRRARDHDQPRRPRGRAPRAAARQASAPRAARSLPRAARAQARRPGALAGARPGARARRLAGLLRRAVGGADRPLRALGGRPRRWSTSLMLCREHGPDAGRAGGPRRARRRRARRPRRRGPRPPRRRRTPAAPAPLTGLEPRLAAHARPGARPRPTTTSCSEAPR